MKVLLANKYFFIKGGAENSFFETGRLLEKHGHQVIYFSMKDKRNYPSPFEDFFVSNVDYESPRLSEKIKAVGRLLYSREAKERLEALIQKERPDIAHLNNIYHQISPSILHTLKKYNIPVVMTLRDYKVVCASYSLMHRGKICEACAHKQFHHALIKGCVKDSKAKSLINTFEMYLHHNILKIYDLVDIFISPSQFLKNKVEQMGFKGKVVHLLNCTSLLEERPSFDWEANTVVFFGRLSREKGVATLIEAVKAIPDLNLRIIGEGPLKEELENKVRKEQISNVHFLGYRVGDELNREIRRSMFIVIPTEMYENNPRTVIEAFAMGKPAVGSRIGGIPELILDNQTGLTFQMGDVEDLRNKLRMMLNNPRHVRVMGEKARIFAEAFLDPEIHYQKLITIYRSLTKQEVPYAEPIAVNSY